MLLFEVNAENSERQYLKAIDILRRKTPKPNEEGGEAHLTASIRNPDAGKKLFSIAAIPCHRQLPPVKTRRFRFEVSIRSGKRSRLHGVGGRIMRNMRAQGGRDRL